MAVRIFVILIAAVATGRASGADNSNFEKSVRPFLEKHCIDCHGADVQKARLRLDNLAPDFGTKDSAEIWIKALDKVASGQMPPPSEDRPPAAELASAKAFLTGQLHRASFARQQSEGRQTLRRLNKTEYENTLSDLFGMHVAVKDLLPDDNSVAGFDNVSQGLAISSSHYLRYQEAAEKLLAEAMPFRPKISKTERKTGLQLTENSAAIKKLLELQCKVDGEHFIVYSRLPRYTGIFVPNAPMNGRYRIRVSAYAINTGGKTMPVVFHYYPDNVREAEVRGCVDAPPDKAAVLECEVELRYRDRIVVNGWTLPYEQDFRRDHKNGMPKDYAGPGLVVEWVELEGPLDAAPGVPYQRLFGDLPVKARSVVDAELKKARVPTIKETRSEFEWLKDPLIPVSVDPRKDSERLLKDFLPRAARRPMPPEALSYFVNFAHARLDKGYTFGEAMLATYKAVLCSPYFLFMTEQSGKLDDYALASRLSYFLWRSMPDAALLEQAAQGALSKPAVLYAEVERMLKDPKAERLVEDFTGQWLELHKINATSPDPQLYGEFDQYLLWSMPTETKMFFTEILDKDLSVTNFIHSDWTFANERLAQHYGIKGVAGSPLSRVSLPSGLHRGGLLTQASILKVTADGTRTSPILRGKWVLENIVGKPPSPPPPDIPSIEPDIRGTTTIRQQLEKHRNTKACASCHMHIDPPGFALETFDVIGGWRDFYRVAKNNGKPIVLENYPNRKTFRGLNVEKGDTMPGGKAFKDIDEYKDILLEDKDQIARNVIEKLTIFATGAEIQFADREVIEQIVAESAKTNHGLRTIIHAIVCSRMFMNK